MKTKKKSVYYASNGTTAVDLNATNMKDAIQEAALKFVANYQNKINSKSNRILEFKVIEGCLDDDDDWCE